MDGSPLPPRLGLEAVTVTAGEVRVIARPMGQIVMVILVLGRKPVPVNVMVPPSGTMSGSVMVLPPLM
jgi:hypothetical protein